MKIQWLCDLHLKANPSFVPMPAPKAAAVWWPTRWATHTKANNTRSMPNAYCSYSAEIAPQVLRTFPRFHDLSQEYL